MALRAIWKGFLKIDEVSCPVSLYTAVSTSDRITLHMINRETGHRVRRQFVDSDTGASVERDDQVKGYEVMLDPADVQAAVPQSDKTLTVSTFIGCDEIDQLYFDKPYYLAPADRNAKEAFDLIREGMRKTKVAAVAQTVLFRRVRSVLIRAHGDGLIATTLNFNYEVRSATDAFRDVPASDVKADMLALAQHIIKTKMGTFDASSFDDRYESALADLVKAKLAGKKIAPRPALNGDKVVDLMEALRESAGLTDGKSAAKVSARPKTAPRRKAG